MEKPQRRRGARHIKLPFHAYGSVGTFAPQRVVWQADVVPSLTCNVCSSEKDKVIIPMVYLIAPSLANKAHFLYSILNTSVVGAFYQAHGYKRVSANFKIGLPCYDVEIHA